MGIGRLEIWTVDPVAPFGPGGSSALISGLRARFQNGSWLREPARRGFVRTGPRGAQPRIKKMKMPRTMMLTSQALAVIQSRTFGIASFARLPSSR